MADLERAKNDALNQFWGEIGKVTAVMLGLQGRQQHLQPMYPFPDSETGEIWFLSKKDAELVKDIGEGQRAIFAVVGSNHDYHASCLGALQQVIDPSKVDELWSANVAAWYEKGKEDPNIALLRFTPIDAEIWASSSNLITFGWEIFKSNLSEKTPDVGVRNHLEFHAT